MNESESLSQILRALERLSDLIERRALPLGPNRFGVGSRAGFNQDRRAEPYRCDRRGAETILAGEWTRAGVLIEALKVDAPDQAARLFEELALARESARERLRGQIDAAREADDPERVIAVRDELQTLLDGFAARELDQQLARWMMSQIQRRLIHPPIGVDVPRLASLAAERFPETKEGASLRKALPTLRRSAGLCPRCAEPFVGVEDACPACLAKSPNLAVSVSIAPAVVVVDRETEEAS